MTDLPPDAVSYRIAAVMPCENLTLNESQPWCVRYPKVPAPCSFCLGDGTRVFVSDVEVELDGERLDFTPERGKHLTWLWREVPRA